MALRGNEQPIAGLSYYWQNAAEKPTTDWKKWVELFEVALMAKFSIAVEEIVREEEGTRKKNCPNGRTRCRNSSEKSGQYPIFSARRSSQKDINR